MGLSYPKPAPRQKAARKPIARTSRPKRSNAYTRPEWRKLAAAVHKRSGNVCEVCRSAPRDGDPHHKSYAPFTNWRRLIVPLDQLVDCCRSCHLAFHSPTQPEADK